jgi:hypothetical protein
MTNTDIQLLVAQARSEADNPAFKVRRGISAPLPSLARCSLAALVCSKRTLLAGMLIRRGRPPGLFPRVRDRPRTCCGPGVRQHG